MMKTADNEMTDWWA